MTWHIEELWDGKDLKTSILNMVEIEVSYFRALSKLPTLKAL